MRCTDGDAVADALRRIAVRIVRTVVPPIGGRHGALHVLVLDDAIVCRSARNEASRKSIEMLKSYLIKMSITGRRAKQTVQLLHQIGIVGAVRAPGHCLAAVAAAQ